MHRRGPNAGAGPTEMVLYIDARHSGPPAVAVIETRRGTNPCSPNLVEPAGHSAVPAFCVPPTGFEPDGCTGPSQWIVVETPGTTTWTGRMRQVRPTVPAMCVSWPASVRTLSRQPWGPWSWICRSRPARTPGETRGERGDADHGTPKAHRKRQHAHVHRSEHEPPCVEGRRSSLLEP